MTALPSREAQEPTEGVSSSPGLPPWPLRGRALIEIAGAYLALVALGLGMGWLLLGPLAGSELAIADESVSVWLAELRSPRWDGLTDIGSGFAGTFNVIAALVVLITAFVWVWRRWREPLTLGLALLLEASVFLTVSLTIGRDRPPVEQLDISPPTASFPSGHTGAAFALYTALAVIVFRKTQRPVPRALAVIGAVLIPLMVAASRMYRGMHYLSDVVAGALLGVICVLLSIAIVDRAIRRRRTDQP